MSEAAAQKPYTLEPGDKATPVAVYTSQALIVGELVTRAAVRVSTWLRTPGLPDFVGVYGATVVRFLGSGEPQVIRVPEIHVAVPQIIALHLAPPGTDEPDYDPTEMNRRMEPVTALAGPFRFDGDMRIPAHMKLARQMELMRDQFLTVYNVAASSAFQPMGVVQTTMVILRPAVFAFAARNPA